MTDDAALPANSAGFDRYFETSLARMAPEGDRADRLLAAIVKALDSLSTAPESPAVTEAATTLRAAIT